MALRPQTLAHWTIYGCWITFAVYWAIAAASTKRTVYQRSGLWRAWYFLIVIVGVVLIGNSYRAPYPLNLPVVPQTGVVSICAAIVSVIGLLFAVWARRSLGRNWSGAVTLKENHELVQHGPYRLVRHPIYTGLLTMLAGSTIFAGYLGCFLGFAIIGFCLWMKLRAEEALMLQEFPGHYPAYAKRVRRLIPFVL
jgi:protein-S-isoprenylcysteine O-methyltransferase Ste14